MAIEIVMQKIEKKVWPEYFEEILKREKTFELRLNDFEINKGDTVGKWKIDDLTKFWPKEEIENKGLQIISLLIDE